MYHLSYFFLFTFLSQICQLISKKSESCSNRVRSAIIVGYNDFLCKLIHLYVDYPCINIQMCDVVPSVVLDSKFLKAFYDAILILTFTLRCERKYKCYLKCVSAPFGKRGWKMYYCTLRELVLYLHKDEHGFRNDSLHNAIRIHHALATKASDYTKKEHVFRLQTADQAEYLFQTR